MLTEKVKQGNEGRDVSNARTAFTQHGLHYCRCMLPLVMRVLPISHAFCFESVSHLLSKVVSAWTSAA